METDQAALRAAGEAGPPAEPSGPPGQASQARPATLTLPSILLAQLVIPLSIAGTAIALPDIAGELGSDPVPLQGVVNGFNIAFAVCTVIWGVAADRMGHRAAFRLGVAVALAGSLASALSPSLVLLDTARVVAGVGAAAVLTGASSLLSSLYTGPARRRAFALFGTVNGLGLALGPSISGFLVSWAGWRGVFLAQALALLVAVALSIAVPKVTVTPMPGRRLLDLSLLRHRTFLAMTLVPVAGAIGFVTLLTYLPNAFSAVLGLDTAGAGLLMLAMTVPVLVAPLAVGQLMVRTRLTSRAVILVSLGCLVVASLGLSGLSSDTEPVHLIGWMIAAGFGFGLPIGLVDDEALASIPADRVGTAAGLLNLARIGSEALAVAGYAAALAAVVAARIADPTLAGEVAAGAQGHSGSYAAAFHTVVLAIAIIVACLALVITLLLRRREPAPQVRP